MTDQLDEVLVVPNTPPQARFPVGIDDVSALMASLRKKLRGSGTGIFYEDGELVVPLDLRDEVINAIGEMPAARKSQLIAYAAGVRYQKEVGGITVSGSRIATDDRAKQMIQGARIAADHDEKFTTPWVTADGTIETMNASALIAISDAVVEHVRNCFVTFADVVKAINAGTITSPLQVDSSDWPD